MLIQVQTDNHIQGNDELAARVQAEVEATFSRFGDQLTRVEVHLNDLNSHKKGDDDKRCMMEARLAGMQPIAVSHQGATLQQAIDGAAEKLEKVLDKHLGKLGDKKGRTSYGGDQTI